MVSKGTFYGAVAVLLAALVLTSSLAVFYYTQYENQVSQTRKYTGELNDALASFRALGASYNSSLRDYNRTLSLLATAVANLNTSTPAYLNASKALSSLWNSYRTLVEVSGQKVLAYGVHMLVDYGNGTRRWYNDTSIQPGWNAYVVTLVLLDGDVQAIWYPQFQEHFVRGLNNDSSGQNDSWFVWVYDNNAWQVSQTGADSIPVYNGTVIAWTLCGYDGNFNPTCSP